MSYPSSIATGDRGSKPKWRPIALIGLALVLLAAGTALAVINRTDGEETWSDVVPLFMVGSFAFGRFGYVGLAPAIALRIGVWAFGIEIRDGHCEVIADDRRRLTFGEKQSLNNSRSAKQFQRNRTG